MSKTNSPHKTPWGLIAGGVTTVAAVGYVILNNGTVVQPTSTPTPASSGTNGAVSSTDVTGQKADLVTIWNASKPQDSDPTKWLNEYVVAVLNKYPAGIIPIYPSPDMVPLFTPKNLQDTFTVATRDKKNYLQYYANTKGEPASYSVTYNTQNHLLTPNAQDLSSLWSTTVGATWQPQEMSATEQTDYRKQLLNSYVNQLFHKYEINANVITFRVFPDPKMAGSSLHQYNAKEFFDTLKVAYGDYLKNIGVPEKDLAAFVSQGLVMDTKGTDPDKYTIICYAPNLVASKIVYERNQGPAK